jgi:hypothetical protein
MKHRFLWSGTWKFPGCHPQEPFGIDAPESATVMKSKPESSHLSPTAKKELLTLQ